MKRHPQGKLAPPPRAKPFGAESICRVCSRDVQGELRKTVRLSGRGSACGGSRGFPCRWNGDLGAHIEQLWETQSQKEGTEACQGVHRKPFPQPGAECQDRTVHFGSLVSLHSDQAVLPPPPPPWVICLNSDPPAVLFSSIAKR